MTVAPGATSGLDISLGVPAACDWAIDQVACPAFRCTTEGAVAHSNRSAQRLWGRPPNVNEKGRWGGFTMLYDAAGMPIAISASPAAIAAETGMAQQAVECISESFDGQRRCLVMHASPIVAKGGTVVGVLCSLTDISERRRLEEEMHQACESRSVFLNILAHELRNPLAPILNGAQTIGQISAEPGIVRMAAVVERQTRQLARFIADLLDASRIEHSCKIPVAVRKSTIGEVVGLAREVAVAQIRSRHQSFRMNIDEAGVALVCDPERVGQALGNGLLNASEYSDDGTGIILTASVEGSLLQIDVEDQGIGVEAYQLRDIFKPFYKASHHPRRIPSGIGLGLAIARGVCDAHGGMVSAHSAGPGKGMRLKFVLPVVADTGRA